MAAVAFHFKNGIAILFTDIEGVLPISYFIIFGIIGLDGSGKLRKSFQHTLAVNGFIAKSGFRLAPSA